MDNAILILAHSNVYGVKFLSEFLHSHFDVYVHWDRKYEIPREIKDDLNSSLMEDRICTLWGGFSLWESMYVPMGNLFSKGYDSVTVISESDVPLMKACEINNCISDSYASLVSFGESRATEHRKKIADVTNPYGMRFAIPGFEKANEIFGDKYKLLNQNIRLSRYIGSQWCTILKCDFELMADYISTKMSLIKTAQVSLLTDEELFPYLISVLHIRHKDNMRYIKWEGELPHPIDLTMDEVLEIYGSNQKKYIFGRKVKFDWNDYNYLLGKLQRA